MLRAGSLVALLLWCHTLHVSAKYCPGISVNQLVETTTSCDGSTWLGSFCCAGSAPGGGYVNCFSTLAYTGDPVFQDYGSFSTDMILLLDAIAPAIYKSTSKASFCTNVGSALDDIDLPATNVCLQTYSEVLEAFGCNSRAGGIQIVA